MDQIVLPGLGPLNFEALSKKYQEWMKSQTPAVEVALTGLQASVQGVFIGYLLGSMSKMDPGGAPGAGDAFKALQTGGPWQQARNLGALTGVNAAMTLAIKKARNGKEDVYGA
jgi:hypothetical protein